MRNQVVTQKRNGPKRLKFINIICIFCLEARSENNILQRICSKGNSITLYKSLGMRNQVETQKERSTRTSHRQNSMHYLSRGESENNRFQNNLLQIQFYHVLLVPWDMQSSRNTKETVPRDFNLYKIL